MHVNISHLIKNGKTCWRSGAITGRLLMEELPILICPVSAGIIIVNRAVVSSKTGTGAGAYFILNRNTGEILPEMVSGVSFCLPTCIRYRNTTVMNLCIGILQQVQAYVLSSIKSHEQTSGLILA